MENEIIAICSSLGCFDGSKYVKEPDCFESLRDLVQALKRDKSTRIRRLLGESNIVTKDLLPILKEYHSIKSLFDVTLRLLVNLTQPVLQCFNGQCPSDAITSSYCLSISSHLSTYKKGFCDTDVFRILAHEVKSFLEQEWEDHDEENRLKVERILSLVRNVFYIPQTDYDVRRTDDDITVHDQLIWTVCKSGFSDLLLFICAINRDANIALYGLEIVSLMLYEQKAEDIVSVGGSARPLEERKADSRELAFLVSRELAKKEALKSKIQPRHSRFCGTYVVEGLKTGGEPYNVISNKAVVSPNDISFDQRKKRKRVPQNRIPPPCTGSQRRTIYQVRLLLREFCIDFLDNCYNRTARTAKDHIRNEVEERGHVNIDMYYMWSLGFFTRFYRYAGVKLDRISETATVQTFHFVQMQIEKYVDMLTVDKSQAKTWGKRVHLGVKAYRELLQLQAFMLKHNNETYKKYAQTTLYNLFYVPEYRDLLLTLLKKFNPAFLSKTYLRDLIETNHLFMKLVEVLTNDGNSRLFVQKKSRRQKKKKTKKQEKVVSSTQDLEKQNELWDGFSEELSSVVRTGPGELAEVAPCDFVEAQTEIEQQIATVQKIKCALKEQHFTEAVSMFRAARSLWPNAQFGPAEMPPDEEFLSLKEIFFSEVPDEKAQNEKVEANAEVFAEEERYGEDDLEESEYPKEYSSSRETELDCKSFVKGYAHPDVMRWYVLALSDLHSLTPTFVHSVTKLLHRVSKGLDVTAVLFQASLFRIFQKLFSDPVYSRDATLNELREFGRFVLKRFFAVSEKNPLVFVELFFWKGFKEAYEIQNGYGSFRSSSPSTATATAWTEELDDELRMLYHEFQTAEPRPEGDVVDYCEEKLSVAKTRKQVLLELKHLGLDVGELRKKANQSNRTLKAKGFWTNEETAELRLLFETFQNSVEDNDDEDTSGQNIVPFHFGGSDTEEPDAINNRSDEDSEEDGDGNSDDSESEESTADPAPPFCLISLDETSKAHFHNTLKLLANNGHFEAIKWIAAALCDAATTKENFGKHESIPVAPFTDEQLAAFDDSCFQELLKFVGIFPPASEQESFWRIHSSIPVAVLRSCAGALMGEHKLEFDLKSPRSYEEGSDAQSLSGFAVLKNRNKNGLKLPSISADSRMSNSNDSSRSSSRVDVPTGTIDRSHSSSNDDSSNHNTHKEVDSDEDITVLKKKRRFALESDDENS